jgi:hypothetical protein
VPPGVDSIGGKSVRYKQFSGARSGIFGAAGWRGGGVVALDPNKAMHSGTA